MTALMNIKCQLFFSCVIFALTILHFPTGGANDAQNVSVDTAHGKDNDHHNL